MKQKYYPTEEELTIIRDNYDGSSFQFSKIIRLIGRGKYPRWYIGRIARDMGLAKVKEPAWTAGEEAYVFDNYPKMGLKFLRAGMIRNSMFPRSTTAIKLKIKRLGIISSDDGFTLRGLQNFLWGGQEQHHIITRWIEKGWLKGKRRGTLRKASRQGGDTWYFDPEWVRAFIIAHPEEIDLRLVDPVAFIHLVAGDNLTLPASCRCPGCGVDLKKGCSTPVCKYCGSTVTIAKPYAPTASHTASLRPIKMRTLTIFSILFLVLDALEKAIYRTKDGSGKR